MIHDTQTLLQSLSAFCTARGVTAWLVGGSVRDLVMERHPYDLDLAVDTDGVTLARDFADETGGSFVELDGERGTGRVVYQQTSAPETHSDNPGDSQPLGEHQHENERYYLDIVQLRAPTLHEDLALRDFTINAMALPLSDTIHDILAGAPHLLNEQLIDPYGGMRDCLARELRLCQPTSFHDDPLRLLRAIRLAASLGLHIGHESDTAIKRDAAGIERVAAERIRDELLKLLTLPTAAPWLTYLDATTLLTRIFPELEASRGCDQPGQHFLPVLEHQIETVACIEWVLAEVVPTTDGTTPRMPAAVPVAIQTHPHVSCSLPYADRLRDHFNGIMRSGYPRRALLKLAALIHDNAKPQTKQAKPEGGVSFYGHQKIGAKTAFQVARRLRLSRRDARYVESIVRHHMRPGHLRRLPETTPRAIARFLRDTSQGDIAAVPDVLLHDLADTLAASGPALDLAAWDEQCAWVGQLLHTYWGTLPDRLHPLVNGHDLMTLFGIESGKLVGIMLHEIQEAQAAGEISSRDEAVALAQKVFDTYSSSVSVVTHT